MLAFSDPADVSAMFVEHVQLRGSGQWRNASRTHARACGGEDRPRCLDPEH
jgi:hypothetical protein